MMRNFREKLKKQGGFTLIEMLIVVAIIAILVAVSIPFIANAMGKTRHATDLANERAAKAEIMVQYMAGAEGMIDNGEAAVTPGKVYAYDANNGILSESAPVAYGQCNSDTTNDHTNMYIVLSIDNNGQVKMAWTSATDVPTDVPTANLCTGETSYKHE